MFVREQKINLRLWKRKLKEASLIQAELEAIKEYSRLFSVSAYYQVKKQK